MLTSKGYLLRGTLRPGQGSAMTGMSRSTSIVIGKPVAVPKPPNRIPSSITLKRSPGSRG